MFGEEARILIKTPRGEVILHGLIKRSWSPFNFHRVLSVLPLRTRSYTIEERIIYFPLNTTLKLEKPISRVEEGQIILIPVLKSMGIVAASGALRRYKASLIGLVEEGLENLQTVKSMASILIDGG